MIKSKSTELLKELINHPMLIQLRNRSVSKEQFLFYVKQKSHLTVNIPNFIFESIQKVEPYLNRKLVNALIDNYKDELGIDKDGISRIENAHVTWKNYFHKTLGITSDKLDRHSVIDGTALHSKRFDTYTREGSAFGMVGCFLMLERLVPLEYRAIQTSRDHLFPELFLDALEDDAKTLENKQRARMYIDGHIAHDSNVHFPLLLEALEPYEGARPDIVQQLEEGMRFLVEMKRDFYDSILSSWESFRRAA